MSKLLKLSQALLADGAACRCTAQRLAITVYAAYCNANSEAEGEEWVSS